MLFTVRELSQIWGISPQGVVHIGAHLAEESDEYTRFNWKPVTWFEAQTDLVAILRETLDSSINEIHEATLWDVNDLEMVFNVTNNGQSSSLLNLGKHATDYPEIVVKQKQIKKTIRFDSPTIKTSHFDFINLDVQGAELHVLKGMGQRILDAKWIYTEINKTDVYDGCVQIAEMDSFLKEKGFHRIATRWCFGKGWGDALYTSLPIYFKPIKRIQKNFYQIKWNTFQILVYLKTYFQKQLPRI